MAENKPQTANEFVIQKIYIKDSSFESPKAPQIFTEKWQPEINLQINSSFKSVSAGTYEVVLNLTVTAKQGERTAFLAEIQQAGLFTVKGFDSKEFTHLMGSYCPNILFPFARETIAAMVNRGGFPQLLIAPINFEALYAQHVAQQEKQPQSATQEPMH
jgi:preprotein translocase subunit SecB